VSTYRTGNHQPQNVYRGDQYIGVMFTAEDAAEVVAALNGRRLTVLQVTPGEMSREDFETFRLAFPQVAADSCTCTVAGPDPACIVHQGRRARGPKPPPLGPSCICDGSGRTCPRHGAVL
jgi:hypothetical protein